MQRKTWQTSPLQTFLETFEEMEDKEEFALEWIGTQDVYEAIRLETINRVYSYKVTHRTLGKEKAPICIELNKPPLDPSFVEEMKEFRYALLLSKVKTELERTHQNDPACNVRGLKDDEGKEIENEDERSSGNDISEANSDSDGNANDEGQGNEEDAENDEDDEDDDEKSDNEQNNDDDDDDDEGKDDNNDHGDNDSDNDDEYDGDSGYDSESSVIGNTEHIHERSPSPSSSPRKENPPCDSSLAVPLPHPDIARDDNKDASPHDENREASPQAQQFPSEPRGVLRNPMNPYPDQEPGIDYLSPEHIMHQMLNALFNAEIIHKQYLDHREKDSRNIVDHSAKVDHLMQTMSHRQPSSSKSNTHDKLAHELHQQRAILDKIAKEQHALKHTQFGLKDRVDLACTKIDLGHNNMFQMAEYQLTMLEYVKDVLNAVKSLTRFSDSPCDDAKKGEKPRKDDDKDEDRNRSPPRGGESRRNNEEKSSTRHEERRNPPPRNTRSPPPRSRSRQQHSSKSRQQHSVKPRQSFRSTSEFSFSGKTTERKRTFAKG
ncbi:PREDICTED: probable ATP-dependent helicase PF08_0048 [Ipomoea nil]|uniref:probable ATP-dependent helicase PF08_0048 n=1 Tax=Ipomoea nil TaxID=35883 RepID=UPI000901BD96|nr:PREDICTED: probable ATP-dependent helicase PF08_0048 [Ipomoea nil]